VTKISEPDGKVTTYSYDASGNRATQTVTGPGVASAITYSYDERNRLIQTVEVRNSQTTTVTYTYDANGNQLTVTEEGPGGTKTSSYSYDEFNRLIASVHDGVSAAYAYNADGFRVGQTVGGVTTTYYYSGKEVVYESSSDGTGKRNVRGINLIARQDDSGTYYYLFNGHGDVMHLVNENGLPVNAYDYDIFGNILSQSETVANPYRYAGYMYDEQTGYYYLNSRYYNPETARFITEDTYRGTQTDPLSLNLYTYANNNPNSYYDPDGNWGILATIGIGAAIGFVAGSVVNFGIQAFTKGIKNVDYLEVGKAGVKGAIGGAIMGGAGLIGGGALVQSSVTIGAGAVGNLAGDAAFGEIKSGKDAAISLAIGGISGGAGLVTGNLAKSGLKKGINQYSKNVAKKFDSSTRSMNRAEAKREAVRLYEKQTGQKVDSSKVNDIFKQYRDELRNNPSSAERLLSRTVQNATLMTTGSTETVNEAINKLLIDPYVNETVEQNEERWKQQWNEAWSDFKSHFEQKKPASKPSPSLPSQPAQKPDAPAGTGNHPLIWPINRNIWPPQGQYRLNESNLPPFGPSSWKLHPDLH
jgi:RHS repeat-associated protein